MNQHEQPSRESAPDRITEAAKEAWRTTKDKAGEVLDTGERYLRENPAVSAISIFSAGILLGLLIGLAIGREDRESYTSRARNLTGRWF